MFMSISLEARTGPVPSISEPSRFSMLAHPGPWISILIAGLSLAAELAQFIPGT